MAGKTLSKGLFITGTDTNIGKTLVSAILVTAFRELGLVGYWKPIQTGIEEDDDTAEVVRLAGCTQEEVLDKGIRLNLPLSPHLSARLSGHEFGINDVLSVIPKNTDERFWIVEGAGGILVPLNRNELMIDFAVSLGLSAVVVSRSGLGTINHTLLTLECLRGNGVDVLGVVMNGPKNPENRSAIEQFGKTRVLLEVPEFEKVNREVVIEMARELKIGE